MAKWFRHACFFIVFLQMAGCESLVYMKSGAVGLPDGPTAADRYYRVAYGTSRKLIDDRYSDIRDDQVHYGRVVVKVPAGHRPGTIDQMKAESIDREKDEASFLRALKKDLKPVFGPENGYLLVFLHGYNNSFQEAAVRAAQIGVDLDVPENNMMFFSWAANSGAIRKYTFDEATIDASEVHLRTFLDTVMKAADGRKVHIIAHSMGNRAFLRTIVSSTAGGKSTLKFGQIILAAADLDRDLFEQHAQKYRTVSERTTVYLSPYDFAVSASEKIHNYPRVGCGERPQVQVAGIENVVSFIPHDIPAHAYFAEAEPILLDIKSLILKNTPLRSGSGWKVNGDYWTVGASVKSGKSKCS